MKKGKEIEMTEVRLRRVEKFRDKIEKRKKELGIKDNQKADFGVV